MYVIPGFYKHKVWKLGISYSGWPVHGIENKKRLRPILGSGTRGHVW